ncbi:unnamed protein product [Schistosoma margrebowiei]|uniref:G_PROTEIN_RECEP_F1_2 domain-containing protein n=1 Tax=Schistosoma margrebowiei TaxID=48269 RepID=A0AA85AQW0_9TREM|nr:unnamed protein product [Schistosoma margrebowiei]
MNHSLFTVKTINPTWNEKRHKFLIILIAFGMISNIILIVIVSLTKSLIKNSFRRSSRKYGEITRSTDKSLSTKHILQSIILSKCCTISNDEKEFIIHSKSTHSCCEFEMNWGCCYYKTQCHSHCFSSSSTVTPVPTTIELNILSSHRNSSYADDSITEIPEKSENLSTNSKTNLDKYNFNQPCEINKSFFLNTNQHLTNYEQYSNSNMNESNLSDMKSNQELTIPSTSIHYHHRSLSSFPNEQPIPDLEQTPWYILCFLIEILAFAQIGYLLFEDLLPWISNLLIFYYNFNIKLKLNINCRLKRMFGTFFLLFEEWCLFLFGIERVYNIYLLNHYGFNKNTQSIMNERNRYKLNLLSIKICTGLFIAIIFSALCNYLWVFGQFHWINSINLMNQTYNITLIETVTCNVRSEYFKFYYSFLIYLDPLFSFIIPHLCSLLFIMIILLHYCLQFIYRQFQRNSTIQTTKILIEDDYFNKLSSYRNFNTFYIMIDRLTTFIYLLDSIIIVILKLWRNIEKSVMVYFHITFNMNYYMIRNELYHLELCLIPIITIIIYLIFHYKIRKYCK